MEQDGMGCIGWSRNDASLSMAMLHTHTHMLYASFRSLVHIVQYIALACHQVSIADS
jgi:hypothetical protein